MRPKRTQTKNNNVRAAGCRPYVVTDYLKIILLNIKTILFHQGNTQRIHSLSLRGSFPVLLRYKPRGFRFLP